MNSENWLAFGVFYLMLLPGKIQPVTTLLLQPILWINCYI